MGKNKGGKGKQKKEVAAMFKVAGVRKSKTKPVNINLKRLKVKNKAKTEAVDKQLQRVHETLTSAQKPTQKQSDERKTPKQIPNIQKAAEEFEKL